MQLMKKININKAQAIIFFIMLVILIWASIHVTVLNGYHSGEYAVGTSAIPENPTKISIDTLERTFIAEREYLDRVNLYLTDLPEDRSGYVKVQLFHGYNVLYTGNKQLAAINPDEWFSIHLGLDLAAGDQYRLVVTSNDTTSLPSIYLAEDGNTPVFTCTYKNNLRIRDKVLVIIFYLSVFIACSFIVFNYQYAIDLIKRLLDYCYTHKWKVGAYSIINTLVAALVIYGSKLAVPDNTIFYFFEIVIFVSSIWMENNIEKLNTEFFTSGRNRMIFALLALYTSFSIVGNKCFIYPINLHVSFSGVLCFVCMSAVVLPLVTSIVYLFGCSKFAQKGAQKNMPRKVYFLCFGIIMFVAMYFVRAFNPAISSPDTVFCMNYAINSIRGVMNWHPPFYILWLKAIVRVWNSTYAVLLVQYVWFAFVFLEGMRLLYRKGIPSAVIIFITTLSALNSGNMVHLTTIWKDIPYAISVFWVTILIARFMLEDQRRSWLIYAELIIALVCTALMRQNGIVVFLALIPILIVTFRKRWKMWAACVLSLALVLIVQFPLYSYLDIQRNPREGGKYIGLGQDIMAVYYNGGSLNDDAMNIVNVLSNNDIAEFGYTPYWANSSYELNIPTTEFITAYVDTFLKNPVLMLRAIVCRQDCVWDLLIGQDGTLGCVNFTGTMDSDATWSSLVQMRQNNFLTERVSEYTARSTNLSLLNMIEWRAGIWTLLTVIAFATCVILRNNHKLWILFSVQIGHILSLILSTGWSDYRYYWPLTLIGLFLILIVPTIGRDEKIYNN
ncbi:hypothetical protein DWZ37_09600 [Clostridiaceae bacterium AF31-3BH]|nr:hypothetical protein DWZ37_09600 [Clostridiaceae bacterium AF31-3BH]